MQPRDNCLPTEPGATAMHGRAGRSVATIAGIVGIADVPRRACCAEGSDGRMPVCWALVVSR
jgi:hypothetical protein